MGRKDFQGRTDIRRAAFRRLQDARALLSKGPAHAHGAKYLGGYAIECKLKAMAMELYDCFTLEQLAVRLKVPEKDVFTHSLESILSQLHRLHQRAMNNRAIWRSFSHVNQWDPSWRYLPGDESDEIKFPAKGFLDDVEVVYNWLEANRG